MNTDQIILRETDNLPLINKDDVLTNADLDGNFIKIYNDLLSLCSAEDSTLIYDVDKSYEIGEYATYDGKLWLSTEVSTGVTPSIDSAEWIDAFPTILAHQKNKDTILDEGGTYEVTAEEIRLFIDAGLTSTTNLSITENTSVSLKINSSTGTDVTLTSANTINAGLLSSTDKVKLNNTSGINTGDQTLLSLNAEDVDNKVTDFTTINDELYPSTQAVSEFVTESIVTALESIVPVTYTRRHQITSSYDYLGYAVTGTSESATSWNLTRLTLDSSGVSSVMTATDSWNNRVTATYI